MSRRKKIALGTGIGCILAVLAIVAVLGSRDERVEVRTEEVRERDLISTITATGSVRARRQVSISSDEMGRVAELLVEEGDDVEEGDVLLRLDSVQLAAVVTRSRAAVNQAEVQVAREQANLDQAVRELTRLEEMNARSPGLVTGQALDQARTQVAVARTLHQSAVHSVEQARPTWTRPWSVSPGPRSGPPWPAA